MRYFMTLVFFLLLGPSHGHACSGSWNSLFFETIPNPQPDADLIAIVSTLGKKEQETGVTVTEMATVIEVLKTSDARIKKGASIAMQLENSSCGPDPRVGSKGMIIAKVGTDSKGRLVVYPYTYTRGDNKITPPAMLPDGFDMNLRTLLIGEEIPKGFAVVLVGLAGKTPIGSLAFDHAQKRFTMFAIFPVRSNTIVAFAVPLGLKELNLSGIGVQKKFEGEISYTSIQRILTKKIDITRPGLYYTATLDTDNPGKFQADPLPDQLKQFRADYASTVGRLEPINFKWPSQ
jgi:hypothetical protein